MIKTVKNNEIEIFMVHTSASKISCGLILTTINNFASNKSVFGYYKKTVFE